MKRKLMFAGTLLLSAVAIFVSSCDKEEDKNDGTTKETIDEIVYAMPEPLQEQPLDEDAKIGDAVTEIDEETDTYCECQKFKASESFDDVMLLDPTSSVIFPGSILDGNSVTNGSYRQIVLPRAPLSISTNFSNINGACSAIVENPSLSTVREAKKKMIDDAEINGATPAKITCQIEEVHSSEQLQLAIGASASYKKANIASNFDFNKKETRSRFLVKFIQVYYTVDVDAPASPANFFASSVTGVDFMNAVGSNASMPVYVSSVQYGRVAYFCMESEERGDSVKAQLDASFDSKIVDANLATKLNKSQYTKNLSIKGTIIGGSGEDAVQSIQGMDKMIEYITKGGNFSKESPAAPISFTLAKLSNNEVFRVVNGTEYVARNCKSTNATIIPKYFYGIKGENDVFGQIKVTLSYDGSSNNENNSFFIFNEGEDSSVSIPTGRKIELPNSEDVAFKLDYKNLDNAKIRVDVKLKEYDKPCSCKRSNSDDYIEKSETYYLRDILNGVAKGMDAEGNVVIDDIQCKVEYKNGHTTCPNYDFTCHGAYHDESTSKTDDRVKFAFKVNL